MLLKHKYRITGVIILLVTLVTLLPSLFRQSGQNNHNNFSAIPSEPQEQMSNQVLPSTEENITEPIKKVVSADHLIQTESNDSPQMVKKQGVVIQLGSFINLQHIDAIKAKLSLLNYHVYTIPTIPIEGKVTRVLVGPYPTTQQAESALHTLQQETKLEGKLIEFNPLKD